MERGTRFIGTATGREGMILFSFPQGTSDQPLPWAKIVLADNGPVFTCRLLSKLTEGGNYGAGQ